MKKKHPWIDRVCKAAAQARGRLEEEELKDRRNWVASLVDQFSLLGAGGRALEAQPGPDEKRAATHEGKAADLRARLKEAKARIGFESVMRNIPKMHPANRRYFAEEIRNEVLPLAVAVADEKRQAAWWRAVKHEEAAPLKCGERFEKTKFEIDVLLARAETHEEQLEQAVQLFRYLRDGLHNFAVGNHRRAAHRLASELRSACWDFDLLATAKPELFADWARRQFGIPGIVSRNQERAASNLALLSKLGEGDDFYFPILPKRGRPVKLKERANALAIRLIQFIDRRFSKWVMEFAPEVGYEPPLRVREAARLEPFGKETWEAWAGVAWLVLAEVSPNRRPEEHPFFHDPETMICKVREERLEKYPKSARRQRRSGFSGSNTKRFLKMLDAMPDEKYPTHTSPSIPRGDLQKKLWEAFELIATGASRRTRQRKKKSK